jgi:hypothetical protein
MLFMQDEIQRMVEEAVPMPRSCVFERNRADYRRKCLTESINNLINFVQNLPNENIRARDKGDTESSIT